ncbi:MAG: response regulator [Opitutae bacterium]|nr:response regulator [Opitutae bacterium]
MNAPPKPVEFLLVDDEAYFQRFVGQVLSRSINCLVVGARNGREAIQRCQTSQPDLILLDINMPVMSGVEALPPIRALLPGTPIVMLTSVAEEEVVEKCVRLGASYFIRKDIRSDLLKTELQEMLRMFFPVQLAAHEQPQSQSRPA